VDESVGDDVRAPANPGGGRLPGEDLHRSFDALDAFNSTRAVLETLAHLELLEERAIGMCDELDGVLHFAPAG